MHTKHKAFAPQEGQGRETASVCFAGKQRKRNSDGTCPGNPHLTAWLQIGSCPGESKLLHRVPVSVTKAALPRDETLVSMPGDELRTDRTDKSSFLAASR